MRITGLIAMPCAFGLALLAEPITALLGGYSGGNLAMATRLMTVLGFTIIFNALVLVSTAIMQAHGHAGRPVINMLIGGVVNLVAVYVLAGMPLINILGTPIGLLMGYVVISILNILSMRRLLPKPPAILPNLLRSFFAAAVMGRSRMGRTVGAESHRRAGDRHRPPDSVRRAGSGGRRQLFLYRCQVQGHHP